MSLLATVGQVNAVLQTARGLVDAVRGGVSSAAAAPQRPFAEILDEAASRLMAARDMDKDGRLGASELGVSREAFARIDVNGDGVVTKEELIRGHRAFAQDQQAARLFAKLDADADARLNAMELGLTAEQFAQVDVNGDGAVDRGELLGAMLSPTGQQV